MDAWTGFIPILLLLPYIIDNILLNFNIICTSILPWPHEIILFLVVMLIYRYKLTWPHKIIFGWNNLSHVVVVICFGRLSWPHEIKYTCISTKNYPDVISRLIYIYILFSLKFRIHCILFLVRGYEINKSGAWEWTEQLDALVLWVDWTMGEMF